ncbi:MAG: mechanosensitive ion channel domain-containing protein [Myxococcota bacterium]
MVEELIELLTQDGRLDPRLSRALGFLLALVAGALFGRLLLRILDRASAVPSVWVETLKEYRVLRWASVLVSTLILDALTPSLLGDSTWLPYVERALEAALVLLTTIVVSRLMSAAVEVQERSQAVQRLPLKVFVQAAQMVLWSYGSLVVVSILLEKNISSLLTGLTAVGALLVYVFRDYILGWNAALQIAANDLLQEGDWVVVEGHEADGVVADIGLTIIKVQNWDKSISIVPSYHIVSQGCRNMRFMFESGGRRIKRAFAVDGFRVRVCDAELKQQLFEDPTVKEIFDASGLREITNLALFRRWLQKWLEDHPDLNTSMTTLVRELPAEGRGVVVEVYAFTATTVWAEHERIKADVHDRVISELGRFDLGLFQDLGGADVAGVAHPSP